MQFLFFDRYNALEFVRDDAIDAQYVAEELRHLATFPDDPSKPITHGMRVGYVDGAGAFQMFEIRQPSRSLPDGLVDYEAEHIAIAELTDHVVEDKRSYATTAAQAVTAVLAGTGWKLGTVDANPTNSASFYYISAWSALLKIRDTWGVSITPRVVISGSMISGRFIDIKPTAGVDRGVRLTLDGSVQQAGIAYDDSKLVTALYGRGKGEQTGTTKAGVDTYGRRITFADAVWSKAGGDPADKPAGQEWVEDTTATAAYGRNGARRAAVAVFANCEDSRELLNLTWARLQEMNHPRVTITLKVLDLFRLGYAGQPLELGDRVTVIIDEWNLAINARVVKLAVDLLRPENTAPTIGDAVTDFVDRNRQLAQSASVGESIAQSVPSLLNGYIDTAVTQIMSSRTGRQTLDDGSEILVSDSGGLAVRLAGSGILLSDSKNPDGTWNWRTAIQGSGIIADEIKTGVLQAALIKILGSDRFFWDAENIIIKHQSNANWEIRIGRYDGVNLGIGFTRDGGQTWQSALDFNGVAFSSQQIMPIVLDDPSYRMNLYLDRNYALGSARVLRWVDRISAATGTSLETLPISPALLPVTNLQNLRLSMDIRVTNISTVGANTLFIGLNYTRADGTATNSGRYWRAPSANMDYTRVEAYVFNLSDIGVQSLDSVRLNAQAFTGELCVKNVKLEYGAGYTSWVPAPEDSADYGERITAAEFQLTQDQIVQKVTSSAKYNTDLQYARNFVIDSSAEIHYVGRYNQATNTIVTNRSLSADTLATTGAEKLRISADIKWSNVATAGANTLFFGVTALDADGVSSNRGRYWQAPTASSPEYSRFQFEPLNLAAYNPQSFTAFYLSSSNTAGDIWIKNIKLEYGDAWSPWRAADEDVGLIESRVNSAELKITDQAIISTVTQSTAYKNSQQSLQSQITQNASGITSLVTKMGEKADQAEVASMLAQAADQVEISVTQLKGRLSAAELQLTQDQIVQKVTSSGKYNIDLQYARNFVIDSSAEIHYIGRYNQATNALVTNRPLSADTLATTGAAKLRISADIKWSNVATVGANTLFFGVTALDVNGASSTRGYYWQAPTASSPEYSRLQFGPLNLSTYNPQSFTAFYLSVQNTAGDIWIKNIKLEYGDAWTPWRAADEDIALLESRVNSAELKITDQAIIATVTQSPAYKNNQQNLQSQITQNASGITSLVTKMDDKASYNEVVSMVTQVADQVDISVTQLKGRLTTAESTLTVQAGQISSKVSANGIVSAINQSPETISINAAKINLNGVVTANNYFRILADGSMQCTNGVFSGTLSAAKGTFAGTLSAASGTFTGSLSAATGTFAGNLTAGTCYFNTLQANNANGIVRIGNWTLSNSGMNYTNGYFVFEYSSSVAHISGTAPMYVGPFTSNVNNSLTLYGDPLKIVGNANYYNMQFWSPNTNELSLTPMQPGKCNIGTSSYYFDVVIAAHHNTVSLRRTKKNIEPLSTRDYDFDALNPVLYEEAASDSGRRFLGLIAEEVEESVPNAVTYSKEDGALDGLDYSRMVVVLIKEVQELKKRIAALEARTAQAPALEGGD
jgi:phage minor structural protein